MQTPISTGRIKKKLFLKKRFLLALLAFSCMSFIVIHTGKNSYKKTSADGTCGITHKHNKNPTPDSIAGPPPNVTGSPFDNGIPSGYGTCQGCHNDSPLNSGAGTPSITSNISVNGYTAGNTYQITAKIIWSGGPPQGSTFGFQCSAQKTNGSPLGTFTANSSTQIKMGAGNSSTQYIEHVQASTSGIGQKAWTFNWTAPVSGTGDVTFYAAFNCADNSGDEFGDNIFTTTLTVHEQTSLPLVCNVSNPTNANCNASCDGTASTSVSGGITPYTYLWSNSQTTSAVTGLCAGIYTVTVTDATPSTKTATVTITEPAAITVTTTSTNASCGQNDGSATAAVISGGASPFTYAWSTSSTSSSATGLGAGSYSITITDATGCIATASVTVGNSGGPTVSLASQTNVSCHGGNNGTASISISGGIAPYAFLWCNGQTTTSATGLTAGLCNVNVTDSSGCLSSIPVTISEPAALSVSVTPVTISCFGMSDGGFTKSTTGGTPPYTYSITPGNQFTNLAAGNYTITATDSLNCSAASAGSLIAPAAVTVTVSCTADWGTGPGRGTATVHPNGGTPPYTYMWSPYGGTSATATGLVYDSYSVTVTDNNGCTQIASIYVPFSNTAVQYYKAPDFAVKVYPNPSAGDFNLEFTAPKEGMYDIVILTLEGQTVYMETMEIPSGVFKKTVSLQENNNAMLVIKIVSKEGAVNVPMIRILSK